MKPIKRILLLIIIIMTISTASSRSSWEKFSNLPATHNKHTNCNNCSQADSCKDANNHANNYSVSSNFIKTDKSTTNSSVAVARSNFSESRINPLRTKRQIYHNHHRWHHRFSAPNSGAMWMQKTFVRPNVVNHRSNFMNKRPNVINKRQHFLNKRPNAIDKRLKVNHERPKIINRPVPPVSKTFPHKFHGRGLRPQNRHALVHHHHHNHHHHHHYKPENPVTSFVTLREMDETTIGPDLASLPDINLPICGLREAENRQIFQRIVGGREAEPFSWPWVVALYRVTFKGGQSFKGAGSLINKRFVLTAAHLVTPEDLKTSVFVVRVGTHMSTDSAEDFAEYAYTVMTVIQHPMYLRGQYYNDIALLKLKPRVTFGELVAPVCLPLTDSDLTGRTVTVTGWGDQTFGGVSSRQLREASFHVQSRESCNASYIKFATRRFPQGITENMICAGDGGKDACQGDSGGPLTILEDGRVIQVGIVSFGYECGNDSFPGVYTKVAPYMPWIAKYCH